MIKIHEQGILYLFLLLVKNEIYLIIKDYIFTDSDCSLLSDDLFQSLSSELGIPLFFETEIPLKIDSAVDDSSINTQDDGIDNQIIEDIYMGEPSTNLKNSDLNILQQSSGILYIFFFSNKLIFIY